MKVSVEYKNCDIKNPYIIDISPESSVEITLEFSRIVTAQSKKIHQASFTELIKKELKKIEWLILGKVQIEINWLLNAVEKQETDKVGDLDNITKPIIDKLSGADGLLIDDSQINSIHSTWSSKNGLIQDNRVKLIINFNNEYSISKNNLLFLQTDSVIYTPVNLDLNNKNELKGMKLFVEALKMKRTLAGKFKKELNTNADRYLVYSEYEFHRTRLGGFDKNQIIKDADFDFICKEKGIDMESIISEFKNIPDNSSKD
ncbi:RusA family crossover junction endodeoxyribonuclease [Elizabethkingia anophelis]|uniref:RusA family crossover junction endodeoxyribonuclease n=1 Tax=Flavobacterium lindanitolerans TaxID=428988 RepID=UPI0031D5898C|nr:RusA family crossover junction endodeoxyribonuclease [Elizabethkingia anophelis]